MTGKPGCELVWWGYRFVFVWMLWLSSLGSISQAIAEDAEKKGGFSYEWSIYGGARFKYTKNGLNYEYSPPLFNEDLIGGNLLMGAEVQLKFNPFVSLKAVVDVGEFSVLQRNTTAVPSQSVTSSSFFGVFFNDYNVLLTSEAYQEAQAALEACKQSAREQGIPESECVNPSFILQESFFFRQLFATFSFNRQQWAQVRVGLFNTKLGRSFIMDGYVLGAGLDINLLKRTGRTLPLQFELEAFLPDSSFTEEGKKSPVFNARLSFTRDKTRKVGFFTTYMYDGNNLAGKLLLPLWQEYFMAAVSERVRDKTGTSISPSCEKGEFSDAEKTAITQSLAPQTRQKVRQQAQAGNDLLETYYDELCNRIPTSYGHHVWLGFEGHWHWNNKFLLEGSAILYIAQITLGLPRGGLLVKPPPTGRFNPPQRSRIPRYPRPRQPRPGQPLVVENLSPQQTAPPERSTFDTELEDRQLTMLSFVGELKAGYRWLPTLTTSAFFLFAMGDSFQRRKTTVNSFMGIIPQVRYTDAFFNGGINAYSSKRGLGISGISGKGYIAPGLNLEYLDGPDYFRKANARLTVAAYWALEPSIYKDANGKSGTFYGAEINLVGGYQVLPWLRPVAQVDFFFPGNFFASASPPALMFQVLVGVDFLVFG